MNYIINLLKPLFVAIAEVFGRLYLEYISKPKDGKYIGPNKDLNDDISSTITDQLDKEAGKEEGKEAGKEAGKNG